MENEDRWRRTSIANYSTIHPHRHPIVLAFGVSKFRPEALALLHIPSISSIQTFIYASAVRACTRRRSMVTCQIPLWIRSVSPNENPNLMKIEQKWKRTQASSRETSPYIFCAVHSILSMAIKWNKHVVPRQFNNRCVVCCNLARCYTYHAAVDVDTLLLHCIWQLLPLWRHGIHFLNINNLVWINVW